MSIAFVDRAPNANELERLRLVLSSFQDGSGMIQLKSGGTLPGWRDVERSVAAVFSGRALEHKGIFDVVLPENASPTYDVGFSVKTKKLNGREIKSLSGAGRVYMELANSPAKFWDALKAKDLDESDFTKKRNASKFGKILISTVHSWHHEAEKQHSEILPGRKLKLNKSVYLVLSYSLPKGGILGEYQWHSFKMEIPADAIWRFSSTKCLRAYDPRHPDEVLIDWYGLSGGQFKYYPRAANALFSSRRFTLEPLKRLVPASEKAARYWPEAWQAAKGGAPFKEAEIIGEIDSLARLSPSKAVRDILAETEKQLNAAIQKPKKID